MWGFWGGLFSGSFKGERADGQTDGRFFLPSKPLFPYLDLFRKALFRAWKWELSKDRVFVSGASWSTCQKRAAVGASLIRFLEGPWTAECNLFCLS